MEIAQVGDAIVGACMSGCREIKRRRDIALNHVSSEVAERFDDMMGIIAGKSAQANTPGGKMQNLAVDLIPGGSAVRTYAIARAMYEEGRTSGNDTKVNEARCLCVKAALEGFTDTALAGFLILPLTKRFRAAARVIGIARQAKNALGSEPESDVFRNMATRLLQNQVIAEKAESALLLARAGRDPSSDNR